MASQTYSTLLVILIGYITLTTALPTKRSQHDVEVNEGDKVRYVKEGAPIELNCTVRGSSPAIIHWLHDGKLIKQSPLDRFSDNTIAPPTTNSAHFDSITTQGRLHIPHATRAHAGKYTCVAETTTSKITKSIAVEVEAAEKPIEPEEVSEESLRIYQFTTDVIQASGSDLYLVCRATQGIDKSAPVVSWRLGDEQMESNPAAGITIHSNGDLEIKSASTLYHWKNSNLKCVATGDNGQVVTEEPWLYIAPL